MKKLHWLIKLSITLSVISFLCSLSIILLRPNSFIPFPAVLIVFAIAFFAGLLSIPAYFASLGVCLGARLLIFILGTISFIVLTQSGILATHAVHDLAYPLMCQSNIRVLGSNLSKFSKSHVGLLPDANWCDVLISLYKVDAHRFVCKASDTRLGQSSYALNKYLIGKKLSTFSADTVMLFETKSGWNQVGDSNALVQNHYPSSSVVFVDGHISYIKEDKIPALKWK